ncbi:MAG TPA: ATP-binding protein [Stackebrandtia sp.]|uniref:sensor histidine kinase n=1 Tax=Stackebrandtia sp. TaxID=2023065 RepID=UPI002D6BB1E6|nr:ATP-binding protein [Stackebrandtia sp.]HZE40747.1 ATP-binding protein [Stackebrandtia sp.]
MTPGDVSARYRGRWDRTPLRVRLVAAVLLLTGGALTLTSIANVYSLQQYMTGQVDDDLDSRAAQLNLNDLNSAQRAQGSRPSVIVDYAVFVDLDGTVAYFPPVKNESQLPDVTNKVITKNIDNKITLPSRDGTTRWRMVIKDVSKLNPGKHAYFALATPLDDVDHAVGRLIWIDLLVGSGVLAGLAAIGVALVRASLYPLREMENTAAAIAAGDMSKRVPERDPRTEVGQLARAFNQMLGHIQTALAAREASEERALASEERMRQFVADASHELRTPLTTVRGFAELYRQRGDADPAETSQLMGRIEAEATRMGLLVEDLLLLARLDAERPFEFRQVDLLSVVVDTITAAEVTANGRHIDLSTQGGPFLVRGDEMRLRQVMSNLVTNAVRHTPGDSHIDVELRSDGEHVEITVADDGPGMSPEQAQRVFERFYRVDKARSRSAGGTGLGLAIVAALVSAHRGEVSVSSEAGEGTRFTVRLALDPDVTGENPVQDRDTEGAARHS